jgi:SSS family solute:Na+ symporter
VDTAGALFAGAIVIQMFFPGADLFTACLALAALAGVYTAAGGLAAVVYTDVLQAIVLLVGASLVSYYSFAGMGFSWQAVVDATPPEKLSLMLPLSDPNLPWLGTLVGVPILGFYFWCTNQFIVQRVLGARSVTHARWGALFAGLLKLSVLYLMVMPGVMAGVLLPGLANPDLVFPTLVGTLLPAGLSGLVFAALLAALMSSTDSTLNSAATLLTLDFIRPTERNWSPRRAAWAGRIAIIVFMLLAAGIAPVISAFPSLFHYLQTALAYLVPPVAAVFLFGRFWRGASASGAFATLVGGHTVSALLFILAQSGAVTLHFTIVAGLLTLLCAAIMVAASLATGPPPAGQVDQLLFRRVSIAPEAGMRWWQDYRVHAALLLLLVSALVAGHW